MKPNNGGQPNIDNVKQSSYRGRDIRAVPATNISSAEKIHQFEPAN